MSIAIFEWLHHRVTAAEAEANEAVDGVPFGHVNREWLELRRKLDPQRELRFFSSPPETWTGFPRCGWEGYAVVEKGELVDFILPAIS